MWLSMLGISWQLPLHDPRLPACINTVSPRARLPRASVGAALLLALPCNGRRASQKPLRTAARSQACRASPLAHHGPVKQLLLGDVPCISINTCSHVSPTDVQPAASRAREGGERRSLAAGGASIV